MQYRNNRKNDDELSALGFGCLRFPKKYADTQEQVIYAIENGVNYFDTSYIYPGNEETLGRVLAQGFRDRIRIATKMPPYFVRGTGDFERIFATQLKRLQTDHIDYYYMHMLTEVSVWERLVGLGILEWIAEKKRSGAISQIGFSYHGGREEFVKLVDIYDWDICMIQYNYLDEHKQAGKKGLEYAAAKGLPVVIMEPLRGGRLVTRLPKDVYRVWERASVRRSAAEWAFRWIWNHPEVTVVLSGMNSMAMLKENLRVASEAEVNSLSAAELALFEEARTVLNETVIVPCTGCGYCLPCPQGVDIPTCFACYNTTRVEGRWQARKEYLMQTSFKNATTNASQCTRCGRCESLCPQNIAIGHHLAQGAKVLEVPVYKVARSVARWFMAMR
ncbi:MAG: aldo/keto reductase [Peptococcaceae bacterium]|nr:aldo/keto reductase [Peptococcaceae bacterium]